MSGSESRARACRAIGRLIGIKPKDDLNDCMDNDSTVNTNVNQQSVDKVSDFYDPKPSISGPLVSQGPTLHRQSYNFRASAEGHDVAAVAVFLRTVATLDGGPTPEVAIGLAGCSTIVNDRCSVDLPLSRDLSTAEPGHYRVRVVAANSHGDSESTEYDFYVDFPYFGFNDFWEQNKLLNGVPADFTHDAFYGANQIGVNTARLNAYEDDYVNCDTGQPKPADPNIGATRAYERLLDDGIKPIIVVFPNCNPAAGEPPSAGGCVQVDSDAQPGEVGPPLDTSADNAAWRTAMATVASRYPGALGLEISNEPNTTRFWGGCDPDVLRYIELLQLAYAGVKTDAESSLPVITAGMAPGGTRLDPSGSFVSRYSWVEYLAWLSYFDAASFADVVGLHPYRPESECDQQSTPSVAQSALQQLAQARDRSSTGFSGLPDPVWVTEVGVSTTGGDCRRFTEANQSSALLSIYQALRAADVPVVVFHSYMDPEQYVGDPADALWEDGTGIVRNGGQAVPQFTQKPAYCILMTERGYDRSPC
ncbi:MAG: hypothetical protein KJ006_02020 [Thermoleophilia bacterium]|nr:hypothetical protein [Thermoleophilia bacterium]